MPILAITNCASPSDNERKLYPIRFSLLKAEETIGKNEILSLCEKTGRSVSSIFREGFYAGCKTEEERNERLHRHYAAQSKFL